MSHEPNSIPPADREFNELYRAAQGSSSSHAPNNTKLNSVKNNPSRDGLTVKHSDFFVQEVNKNIKIADSTLYRSQVTTATVTFVGAKTGFMQEISCNPNNFEWYVKPGYEHLIRIYSGDPPTHPKNTDWNLSTQYGAHSILIKNIAPCSDEDVTAYICCKFKDDFNETIGASKGYDTELTGAVVCEKNLVKTNLTTIKMTGNAHASKAYDNELEIAGNDGTTGQNYGKYNSSPAGSGRKFITLLDNCQDLLLRSVFSGPANILDNIYNVDVMWQKEKTNADGTTEWVDMNISTGLHYKPAYFDALKDTNNTTGNAGQLTKWFQGGTTSKDSKAWLNVQGTHGSGKYRALVSLTADREDPYTCVLESNSQSLSIVPRIPPFTVKGVGYGCHGDPMTLTVEPTKYTRSVAAQEISTSSIRYEVYRLRDGGFDVLAGWTKPNDGAPFNWTINDSEADGSYYTVRALTVPNGSNKVTPGDQFMPGYGIRYASDKSAYSGFNRGPTQSTWGEWWNTAPFKRRVVPAIETPQVTEAKGKNMSFTRLRWKWNPVANPSGGTLTYQIRVIHHDQGANWSEKVPWTDIGSSRTYTDNNALDSDNASLGDAQTALQIRAKIVPPSTGFDSTDSIAACYSKTIAQSIINARNCNTISATMPVPVLEVSSNTAGNEKPIFTMNYTGKSWSVPYEEAALKANFVNIKVKPIGASDNAYSDLTQTVANAKGVGNLVTTIGGIKYIQYGTGDWFATDYSFGKGKTIKFTGRTRYSDASKSCYNSPRAITISTVQANAIWSWSGSKPSSYSYGSHYGSTRTTGVANFTSGMTLGSTTQSDCTRYGFGIGCDNLPDWAVTGVHEQDGMTLLKYAGAGIAIKQLPQPTLGGKARWPSVTLKVIGATHPNAAHVKYNINSGKAYSPTSGLRADTILNINHTPPWVLSMQMTSPGRTYNNKEHVTNTIQRTQVSTSKRNSVDTSTNKYYENLTGSSRIVSQRTSW